MGGRSAAHFIPKSKRSTHRTKHKNPAAEIFRTELHHNQGSLVEYAVAKPLHANSLH